MTTRYNDSLEWEILERIAGDLAHYFETDNVEVVQRRLDAVEVLFGDQAKLDVAMRAEDMAAQAPHDRYIDHQIEAERDARHEHERILTEDRWDRTDYGLTKREW